MPPVPHSFKRTCFDPRSRQALIDVACHVDDPLTEAVCWNGFWLLLTSGEVPPYEFADMVCRRLAAGDLPRSGVEILLRRAVEAADFWVDPALRAELRAGIARAIWRDRRGSASGHYAVRVRWAPLRAHRPAGSSPCWTHGWPTRTCRTG